MTGASMGGKGQLPTGQVTFVFTDIEGSTALLTRLDDAYGGLLAEHHRILYDAFESVGGQVFGSAGDALFAAFADPREALAGAVTGQLRLLERNRTSGVHLAVRMGIHTGPAVIGPTGYVGLGLHHTARVAALAQGSQILVSDATAALVADAPLAGGPTLDDLGTFRLRDVPGARHLFCVRHPALPANFAPRGGVAPPPGNLPAPLTSFVNRDHESTELAQLLARSRIVTLVATSGTGKTRLALEVARAARDRFPDGVWVVELSDVGDGSDVVGALASVVGLRDQSLQEDGATGTVVRHLSGWKSLVVLDNCEHVVAGVNRLVTALARGAPELRVLATSQRPLHVQGEMIYRLDPLGVPGADDDPFDAHSVQLFVERARAVRNRFELDSRSAPLVARICRQLDGIPLAIELAAAHLAALSPAQLADRLEDSFRIPVPSPGGPPRHATLRTAVGWSYELLSSTERSLLARLSVFAGGCTLDAAEAICEASDLPRPLVMGTLASLVEKSLVVFDDRSDPPVYRLLQLVRVFAAERLAEHGESAYLELRHVEWYLDLVERIAPELTGPEQGRMEDLLDADLDNLRAAFARAMSGPEAGPVLRLVNAVWRFLEDRGHWRDWQRWFDQAIGHGGPAEPAVLGWALAYGSVVAERLGDLDLCDARATAAVELFTSLGDDAGASFALGLLGSSAMDRGDPDDAISFIERALAMRSGLGDQRGIGVSLANLGKAHYERGDFRTARPLMEQALAHFEDLNDTARVIAQLGDLAQVSIADGAIEKAFEYAAKGADLARQAGHRHLAAWNTTLLGRVVAAQGNPDDGVALLADAIVVFSDLSDDRSLLTAVGDLAVVLSGRDPLFAAELLAAVRAIRARRRLPPDAEEHLRYASADEAIAACVPSHALAAAVARGARLSLDQAVRQCLSLVGIA